METQQEEEQTQFTQINRQAQRAADSMESTLMARKVPNNLALSLDLRLHSKKAWFQDY